MKRGPMGCVAFEGVIPSSIDLGRRGPGFAVDVFNVLGAGDAFMAGLLEAGSVATLDQALQYANACGAIDISSMGVLNHADSGNWNSFWAERHPSGTGQDRNLSTFTVPPPANQPRQRAGCVSV